MLAANLVAAAVVTAAPTLQQTPVDQLGTLPAGIGLARGEKVAADVEARDLDGKPVNLATLFAQGPTLVVFYRGGWCPFCNLQLHELAQKAGAFKSRGVSLLGISVDVPTEAARTTARHAVPFSLLSDPTLAVHQAFRVVHHAGDAEVAALREFRIDVEAASGQKHHSFAVPSVFLLNKQGQVLWSHANEDFKTRPSGQQLLDAATAALKP